jgi:predicted glycosyltransferase
MSIYPLLFSRDLESNQFPVKEYFKAPERWYVVRFSAHDASHDRRITGIDRQWRERLVSYLVNLGPTVVSAEGHGTRLLRIERGALTSRDIPPSHYLQILSGASLFVGDSQSVAAEAALLGVPSFRLSGFTGKVFPLILLEQWGLIKNYTPGQELQLYRDVQSCVEDLEERVKRARSIADQRKEQAQDQLDWYISLILSLLD